MIKNVNSYSRYLNIQGGNPSCLPTIYNNTTTGTHSFAGSIRFNISTQSLEIFDGIIWQQWHNSTATVNLTPEAEGILNWAKDKMQEEAKLEQLAKENSTVNDLLQQIKEKQGQLKVVTTLIKSSETVA
jgi:short-subunit dehydrogenase involved in D-alanine esterification of teichoic acids